MTIDPKNQSRLQFLVRTVRTECQHLNSTDQRLFREPFTPQRAGQLETDEDLAERVEAFVGRFGRLQDTVGDKLLPVLLIALGEMPGAAIDNLDRAERLGLIVSADEWMTMRKLRNQMVHEYVEDRVVLAAALQTGHDFLPTLVGAAHSLIMKVANRDADVMQFPPALSEDNDVLCLDNFYSEEDIRLAAQIIER